MDIVHHAFIGGAGFFIASGIDQPLAGVAFIAGSVFPDLDVIFMALGKRFYLRNHQGITHSVLLAPLYAALLIALPLNILLVLGWSWPVFAGALLGLLIHIALDWFNTFRIQLFAPFSKKRFSLDAVFFIDTIAIGFTAAFYGIHLYLEWAVNPAWYPTAFIIYFLVKKMIQQLVRHRLNCQFAIPSAVNPLSFYVLEATSQGQKSYLYNAFTKTRGDEKFFIEPPANITELANQSQVFQDMKLITRSYHITEVHKDQQGTRLIAQDLAVRNFGGRFARTELTFDKDDNLIHEMANI